MSDTSDKTGRFGLYANKDSAALAYKSIMERINNAVSDGRHYLIWIRSYDVPEMTGRMFTDDNRIKITVRVVLSDYTKAEIGEFTILPCDGFSHPDVEKFSIPGEGDWPIHIAKIGDVYLEETGWVAPNYQSAWLRIREDYEMKYGLNT